MGVSIKMFQDLDFKQIKLGQFELIQEETPRSHLEPWRDAQSKK